MLPQKFIREISHWVNFFFINSAFLFNSIENKLFLALQKELAGDNIKVHLVSPMFVKTNMISFSTTAPRGNLLFPTPEKYARSTINKIDKCSHTCGYWIHGIQVSFTYIHLNDFQLKFSPSSPVCYYEIIT